MVGHGHRSGISYYLCFINPSLFGMIWGFFVCVLSGIGCFCSFEINKKRVKRTQKEIEPRLIDAGEEEKPWLKAFEK